MKTCPLCGKDAEDGQAGCECGYTFRTGPYIPTAERVAAATPPGRPGKGLSTFGIVLFQVGIIVMLYAGIMFDPSVESGSDLYGLPQRINNNGLLQQQLMLFIGGGSAFVAGAILWSAGAIMGAVSRGE